VFDETDILLYVDTHTVMNKFKRSWLECTSK
jgi:hypothetical protein